MSDIGKSYHPKFAGTRVPALMPRGKCVTNRAGLSITAKTRLPECHSGAFPLSTCESICHSRPREALLFPSRCLYQASLWGQSRGGVSARGVAAGSCAAEHRGGEQSFGDG